LLAPTTLSLAKFSMILPFDDDPHGTLNRIIESVQTATEILAG